MPYLTGKFGNAASATTSSAGAEKAVEIGASRLHG